MTEAKNQEELRAELVAKAAADEDFRARLVADPKAAIKEALGFELPESVAVHVHEETATKAHVVLPPNPQLTDADLEAISAGHTLRDTYRGPIEHGHRNPDGSWYFHK